MRTLATLRPDVSLLLAASVLLCACGSSPGGPEVEPGTSPLEPPAVRTRATLPGTPATHLGRSLLPQSDVVVRARVERVTDARAGMEIGHFVPLETLYGDELKPAFGDTIRVLAGERGLFPSAGREAVLFLAVRSGSQAHDLVQVMRLSDVEAKERIASLRQYLAIEALPTEAERVAELKAHLRASVRDPRRWTRANAALEYGSLARARPGDLDGSDVDAILSGLDLARDEDARQSLEAALARAQENSDGARTAVVALPLAASETDGNGGLSGPDAAAGGLTEADVAAHLERFREATEPAARRDALLAAAVALEQAALPIVRRGLTDASPAVREAALAAAGQYEMTSLGEGVLTVLRTEDDPAVMRSAVRAAGYLRLAGGVPELAPLARRANALGDEAARALARIRDTDALAALLDAQAAATGPRRVALAALLDDEFEVAERDAGRGVGPR